jgi:hypothetical protein
MQKIYFGHWAVFPQYIFASPLPPPAENYAELRPQLLTAVCTSNLWTSASEYYICIFSVQQFGPVFDKTKHQRDQKWMQYEIVKHIYKICVPFFVSFSSTFGLKIANMST